MRWTTRSARLVSRCQFLAPYDDFKPVFPVVVDQQEPILALLSFCLANATTGSLVHDRGLDSQAWPHSSPDFSGSGSADRRLNSTNRTRLVIVPSASGTVMSPPSS